MLESSKRILVADDSETVRKLIKDHLLQVRDDFEVCGEAANGAEAIEKAKNLRPDLILLDLAMPEMNGVQAASTLKSIMPEVPIILFTIYNGDTVKSLAAAAGIDLVLSKPDGMKPLIEAIDILLGMKSDERTP